MVTKRRIGRWMLFGLAGVGAVVVILRIGGQLYLNSAGGRHLVAEKLGDLVGLPVQVDDVEIGSRSSSLKFRILDPALGDSPNAEVLSVGNATADVSFADLVTGRATPKELHLSDVTIAVRLDSQGKLLTTLPTFTSSGGNGPVPAITVENVKAIVRQEGRPEFAFGGVTLKVEPSGDKVILSGTANEPNWGKWKLSGEANPSTKTGWADATGDDVPLTLDQLRSIPMVPPSAWEQAQPSGHATLKGHFVLSPGNAFQYDVTLRPKGAALGLPAAAVTVTDLAGVIRVHDGIAEIGGTDPKQPGMSGKVAGGTVTVGTKADFNTDPTVCDPLTVAVDHLLVEKLPEKWGLKKLIGADAPGAYLTGRAKLKLVAHKGGKLETYGRGQGEMTLPQIFGGQGKIDVTLGGNGERLEFGRGSAVPKPPPAPKAPMSQASSDRQVTGEKAHPSHGWAFMAAQIILPAVVTLPPARTDQTNLAATITLKDIDIAQFLQQLKITIPYHVAGKATVQAQLGVPLGQAATQSAYKLTGTLTSPELRFEGLVVRDITTQVDYQNGTLTLTALRGSLPQPGNAQAAPGTFSGTAFAAIDPPGNVTASLTLERIPLGGIAAAVPNSELSLAGLVSGKAEFQAPFDKISDPATWNASASVKSDSLTFAGRAAKDIILVVTVAKGVAKIADAAVTIEGIPVTAGGSLTLSGKYPFDATIRTTGTDVTDLRRLVPGVDLPPVEGVLATESKASGTLTPLTYTASGRITASKLTLSKTPANHLDVKWALAPDRLKVTDLSAGVFGGTVNGSLDYPFTPNQTGNFALRFKDVNLAAAAAFVPDFPVKITGAVSVKVGGTIPPAKEGQARIGNLDVDITAPTLTVQGISAERLVGKAAIRDGAVDYSLEGKTLGGSFEVKGRYPGLSKKDANVVPAGAQEPKPPAPKEGNRGSLRITGIDLGQLAGVLKSQSLRPLRGRVDATFDYANDLSSGAGRITIRRLAWGTTEAAQELSGVVLLRDGVLELREFSGGIARGTLRARARVQLRNPSRNFVLISLSRVDAAQLAAAVPQLKGRVSGDVSATVHGTFGRAMHGSGWVALTRGTVAGAQLSDLRVPFDYAASPSGYGRLTIREATTRAGTGTGLGRAVASGTITWGLGTGARVDGRVQFMDTPLKALSPALGANALIGTGRITGRFDVTGSNVHSANDLTGHLVAILTNTSPTEIPLLSMATPYLNPLGVTKPFQQGDVRGTLSRGVFRVQRLALVNPSAQVYADGAITTAGRLDLNVMAHTGTTGAQAVGLQVLIGRIPAIGPIPIGLIRDVSNLVRNRTIRLSITGSVASPVVQVNTGALLREEAVRFLLTRYVLPGGIGQAFGAGLAGASLGEIPGNR